MPGAAHAQAQSNPSLVLGAEKGFKLQGTLWPRGLIRRQFRTNQGTLLPVLQAGQQMGNTKHKPIVYKTPSSAVRLGFEVGQEGARR